MDAYFFVRPPLLLPPLPLSQPTFFFLPPSERLLFSFTDRLFFAFARAIDFKFKVMNLIM